MEKWRNYCGEINSVVRKFFYPRRLKMLIMYLPIPNNLINNIMKRGLFLRGWWRDGMSSQVAVNDPTTLDMYMETI